jgi:hypothetical protein
MSAESEELEDTLEIKRVMNEVTSTANKVWE